MQVDPRGVRDDDLLILIDPQIDFCPGGALAVPAGDEVIGLLNGLAYRFPHLLLTQDWHPRHHASFASSHPGRVPFETIELPYGRQILWPDHCIQGTRGAEFHPGLDVPRAELVIRKGTDAGVDSYSAFFENDRATPTGLAGYLRERRFRRLFLSGLATDYCVLYTALDARRLGFEVSVIEDACRGIDLEGSVDEAWNRMKSHGIGRLVSDELRFGRPNMD